MTSWYQHRGPQAGWVRGRLGRRLEAAIRATLAKLVHLVRAAVPRMRQRHSGRIVNIASLSAKQPIDGLALSNVFRPAIVGLAKTLANELGKDGILVNTVCPGSTRTDRLDELALNRAVAAGTSPEQVRGDLARRLPLGRVAEAEEVAAVVAFLCSGRASYLTGATIPIDGGAVRGLL